MISKVELGRRLREARVQKGLTLKQLDEKSGFSATHISEIERGKTSPTIGALIRIANALGKEPSFFIEDNLLPEIAVTPRDQGEKYSVPAADVEFLTPGIPGGRLQGVLVRMVPGAPDLELPAAEGEEGGYVVHGEILFTIGSDSFELGAGDAIHHSAEQPRRVRVRGNAPAELVLMSSFRMKPGVQNGS